MDQADAHKMAVQSAVPPGGFVDMDEEHRRFDGDDSNMSNIIERDIQAVRDQKRNMARELERLHGDGLLSNERRAADAARIRELDAQIRQLQATQAEQQSPVYFLTPFSGLRNSLAEDNPLAYAGELPGTAHVALYSEASIREAGLPVTLKTDEQIRVAALGNQLMQHCVAVIRLDFE